MKCKHCPAFGHTYYEKTGLSLCFCSGKPTTKVKSDADCQYDIEDYRTYWEKLLVSSGINHRKGEES